MHRFLHMGMYSMLLFLLNLFCIIVFAMLTFRLKRVGKSQLLAEDPHYSSAYSFRLSGTGEDGADTGAGAGAAAAAGVARLGAVLGAAATGKEAYVELEERGGGGGGEEVAVVVK